MTKNGRGRKVSRNALGCANNALLGSEEAKEQRVLQLVYVDSKYSPYRTTQSDTRKYVWTP